MKLHGGYSLAPLGHQQLQQLQQQQHQQQQQYQHQQQQLLPSMMAQQQQQQADQLIHNHALFPEVLDALRRCEVAGLNTASAAELGLAGGAPAPSSSSNNIPSSALPPLPSHFGGDGSDRSDSTDDYVIKYIELQRQHAAQLEKVYDLCDQFSSRYLTLLKEGAQRFTTTVNAAQEGGGGKRKGDALDSEANKKRRGNLPKRATNILKKWLFEHLFHPYPSEVPFLPFISSSISSSYCVIVPLLAT